MARAVDPSGRLSNQDFEIQLQRLGATGLFTSKIQAGASLDQVIEDFQRTQRRLILLNEVATAPKFGIREARLLKADRIARGALNAAYRAGSMVESSIVKEGPLEGKVDLEGFALVSDLQTLDGGEVYYADGEYRNANGSILEADNVIEKAQ